MTPDGRERLDIVGFGTSKPAPGFLSSDFEGCSLSGYADEDIVFHEFSHTVHMDGMPDEMKERVQALYEQYKVASPYYNIQSYAFSTDVEFLSQVFCEVTIRKDVTAGIDKTILKSRLPDMCAFLDSPYDLSVNRIKQASCKAPCAKALTRCAL